MIYFQRRTLQGNTVGSCESKKIWQGSWQRIKQSISLSQGQKDLIIGSLLGDGTMRIGVGSINANYKVDHGLKQREYAFWKYEALQNFVFTHPKISYRTHEDGERYKKSWWFRTLSHPELTIIFKKFYRLIDDSGHCKKIVPKNIGDDLNARAVAIWIMDDGSYSYARNVIEISTNAFSLREIHLLQQTLQRLFSITARHCRDGDRGYRMILNQKETQKLIKVISPYIIPSMMYKIGIRNPVTTDS